MLKRYEVKTARAFRTLTALIGAAIVLNGCAPEVEDTPPEEPPVTEVVTDAAEFVNGEWVQDLWVYESMATIDEHGEPVELLGDILSELTSPDTSFELPHDGTLHVFDSLLPSIVDGDGNPRTDVDVVAGVLEHDGERGLAVLASPHANSTTPIGLDDSVEFDVTFLGEKLQPGDPLLMDYVFLQARPAADEPELAGVELLAERISEGRAFTFGEDTAGEQAVFAYTRVLGQAVEGSTRVQGPAKENMGDHTIDAITGQGTKCIVRPGIGCVRKYHQKVVGGFKKTFGLVDCNLSPSSCDKPQPPSQPDPPKPWCGYACRKPSLVHGDPHLRSFDGLAHNMQGVGEYVLTTGPDLDIHIRTEPATPHHRSVSSVGMVAVLIDGHHIVVDVHDHQLQARINDNIVTHDANFSEVTELELDEVTIFLDSGSIIISAPHHEIGVVITHKGHWMSVSTYLPESATGYSGLLGDNDGDPENDLRARDGTLIEQVYPFDRYYETFADSWRVSPSESLLHYETGETTDTFTDLTFPDLDVPSPNTGEVARAEAVCAAAGITEATLLSECAFDYAVTGDIAFVQSAHSVATLDLGISATLSKTLVTSEWEGEASAPDDIVEPTAEEAEAWRVNMSGSQLGDTVRHTCPPGGPLHSAWGGENNMYTDDSSLCTAAVHAGLITLERGGTITATRVEGLEEYPSSERNGVTTNRWGSWHGSIVLE